MKPTHIIIHHSLTKDSQTVSWDAIRRYHMKELRWRDIGYHFGIEMVGNHYEVIQGRMMDETGAHCKEDNMNRRSLGICFVGNFDEQEPPEKQWLLGIRLVRSLLVSLDMTYEQVLGHRELAPCKSCPGKRFDLDLFRSHLGHEILAMVGA